MIWNRSQDGRRLTLRKQEPAATPSLRPTDDAGVSKLSRQRPSRPKTIGALCLLRGRERRKWLRKRHICRKKEKSDATAENGDGQRDHQGSEFTARPQDERSHPEQQVDGHIEKRHRWNEGDGELRRKMNRDTKGAPRGECVHPAIDQHKPKRVYEGQQRCITKMPPARPRQERCGSLHRLGLGDFYDCGKRRQFSSSSKY